MADETRAREPFGLKPLGEDGGEVLRATIARDDGEGSIEVRAWTRTYGPYLRYALRVDERRDAEQGHRPSPQGSHPFRELDEDDLSEDGFVHSEIVADNEVTRALLAVVALPDAELKKRCGNCSPGIYRARLIHCLKALWD